MAHKSLKKVYRNGNVGWITSTNYFETNKPLENRHKLINVGSDEGNEITIAIKKDSDAKTEACPTFMHRLKWTRLFGIFMTLLIVAFCLGLMTRQTYFCINK